MNAASLQPYQIHLFQKNASSSSSSSSHPNSSATRSSCPYHSINPPVPKRIRTNSPAARRSSLQTYQFTCDTHPNTDSPAAHNPTNPPVPEAETSTAQTSESSPIASPEVVAPKSQGCQVVREILSDRRRESTLHYFFIMFFSGIWAG